MQETRLTRNDDRAAAEGAAKQAGWRVSIGKGKQGDKGRIKAGTAIGCSNSLGAAKSCSDLIPEEHEQRFPIAWVNGFIKGRWFAISVYLIDG